MNKDILAKAILLDYQEKALGLQKKMEDSGDFRAMADIFREMADLVDTTADEFDDLEAKLDEA